ncbi:MAG: hypothetical protein ACP5OA_01000 [Candidatus Woesearchaeota archaeon]
MRYFRNRNKGIITLGRDDRPFALVFCILSVMIRITDKYVIHHEEPSRSEQIMSQKEAIEESNNSMIGYERQNIILSDTSRKKTFYYTPRSQSLDTYVIDINYVRNTQIEQSRCLPYTRSMIGNEKKNYLMHNQYK